MPPRFFVDTLLQTDASMSLPEGPTRHTQVLRMQPGDHLDLFNGGGGEWHASIEQMTRSVTTVRILQHRATDRELACSVTLAVGMPANERMDWLVEKAAELGVAAIQPLECQRAVLRLSGARADKRVAHWQAIAVAACEQSGRTNVPRVHPIQNVTAWLDSQSKESSPQARLILSLRDTRSLASALDASSVIKSACFMSGPEGGLTEEEESAAIAAGFTAVSLGPRVLRADTAPIAALTLIGNR